MKYLFFILALFATTTAHSQCSEFDNLLKKGDNYLKGSKPNYQEAINSYTAAILACSDRAGEAKQRITRMVNKINKLKESAVTAEKKATEAQKETASERDKVQAALENLEKANASIEAQRQKAEENYRIAQQATLDAQAERNKVQNALTNLEKANANVVKLILENSDHDILNLRYEDALQKIKAAASLGALKPEVVNAYLEIAFWYGETGNVQRAKGILDSAVALGNKKVVSDQPYRKSIEAIDPDTYAKLMERYYPVLVQVEGGTFDMGCDPGERCKDLHQQKVSTFKMAKYETTWWQYHLFCKATGHEYESPGWGTEGDNPVVKVSWFDAALYLNWVNRQFGLDTFYTIKDKFQGNYSDYYDVAFNPNVKKGYRLPTEAEWEYAAKGGNNPSRMTIYSGSNNLDLVGWYNGNSSNRSRSVGKKQANALGLYDMSGNVYEWCWDWDESYKTDSEKDYKGPVKGSYRVFRGGSWNNFAEDCRTADRSGFDPDSRNSGLGFRVVFVP